MFFFFLSLNFISCNNEIDIDNHEKRMIEQPESFTVNVKYKGANYTSICHLENDSLIYENVALGTLIDSLYVNNPNLNTYVHEDGLIEYIENTENILKPVLNENFNKIGTKSELTDYELEHLAGMAKLWEHPDYKGWHLPELIPKNLINAPAWGPKDLSIDNDKISSIEVFCNSLSCRAILVCYEDPGFGGHTLTIKTIAGFVSRKADLSFIPFGKKTWNDRISSYTFEVTDRLF